MACFLIVMAACLFFLVPAIVQGGGPACLELKPEMPVESCVSDAGISDGELLARLVYAESMSTGFLDDPLVYETIAWGVMNRVRLGEASPSMQKVYGRGIRGVVFRKGQFNPAVSKRSPFSREFLCPKHTQRWSLAESAAARAMAGEGNPFIATEWEKKNRISLVVNFYYPGSIQAKTPLAPWEDSRGLRFIGDVALEEGLLSASRVRFYRLTRPPKDVKGALWNRK